VIRPEAPASGNRWGLGEAVIAFAAGLLLSALGAALAEAATGYRASSSAGLPVAVTGADLAGLWIGLVGGAVLASRRRGSGNLRRDYGLSWGRWWDLPVGAGIGLACQYGLIPLLYLPFEQVDRHLRHQLGQPVQKDTSAVHGPGSVTLLFVLIAVGAPIVEELFFRGLLLRSLLGRTPVPVAVLASALLFGLAHFEAAQFAGLAAFGVVLALLAWRTGRLTPGMGAHAAFNAVALLSVVHLR
jgi:membrane protease YdiL (CAAX protease family)